jgi:endonuclease YncB( thermonuclease family)
MPATPATFDYAGTVTHVADGDTVVLTLAHVADPGFGIRQTLELPGQRLRLAGLDCKPLKTDLGDRAKAWLEARTGGGRTLHVVTVKNALGADKHEKFGRWLAVLHLTDDAGATLTPSLNDEMVEAGLAVEWSGKGPHPL